MTTALLTEGGWEKGDECSLWELFDILRLACDFENCHGASTCKSHSGYAPALFDASFSYLPITG